MLQSDFGSLPMSYAFMGMRFSLSRQLVLCALGSMESWVWHFLHSHVMLHVTTRWWNHQPWKPLGQVSTSKGRVAILKYTSGCTKAVKGFQSFKPVRTEQLTRSSVQGTCMFVGFELHKQLYWSCLPVPGGMHEVLFRSHQRSSTKTHTRRSHFARPYGCATSKGRSMYFCAWDHNKIWCHLDRKHWNHQAIFRSCLQSHWTPTPLLLTTSYKFFTIWKSFWGTWPYLLEPVAKVASNRSCIWKAHCLEIATRPQRSPDPGPWHDVAHSLPAAVPSLNHSPASSLELRITRSKHIKTLSSSSVEFRFSARPERTVTPLPLCTQGSFSAQMFCGPSRCCCW